MARRRQRLRSLGKRILSENRTGRGTIAADSTANFRIDTNQFVPKVNDDQLFLSQLMEVV